MKREEFIEEFKNLITELFKENNITINCFEEQHDLYFDTFNISVSCKREEELL